MSATVQLDSNLPNPTKNSPNFYLTTFFVSSEVKSVLFHNQNIAKNLVCNS